MKLDLNPFRKKKKVHTSVTLDSDVYKCAKIFCKKEGIKLSALVNLLLKEWIKEAPKKG